MAAFAALSAVASTAPPTRLVLVRHATTAHTSGGRYSGRADVALDPNGTEQATRLASRLPVEFPAVSAVVTSPLARCTDTAGPVAAAYGVPMTTDDGLAECDFGEWDGLTFAEARAGWPDVHTAWLGSTAVAPPGGESFDAVAGRVRRFVEHARVVYAGRSIVVVAHTAPLKLLLRDALGAGRDALHSLVLDPAGISVLDIWPDGGVAVSRVNDTCHGR